MEIGQSTATSTAAEEDRQYDAFRARVQARFEINLHDCGYQLFTTDAQGLWEAYLAAMPEASRQWHNCNACRRFIEAYGSLVAIDGEGVARSAMWALEDAPPYYRPAVSAVLKLVNRAKVTGPYHSRLPTWGYPSHVTSTGHTWTHFALGVPRAALAITGPYTCHQTMAFRRQDFGNVARALSEYSEEHLTQAVALLRSDALYRSEKVLGAAEWLLDLSKRRAAAKGKRGREGILWRAVAEAPAGFCHPRASMIGTLLDDLAAGLPFLEVASRFKAKMHPLQYQRPQAPPAPGNVKQAEELVAKLGLAASLRRRFARVEEIEAVWRPPAAEEFTAAPPAEGAVFAHLLKGGKSKGGLTMLPHVQVMTWVKFAAEVLPEATKIEYEVRPRDANFCAYVTAADPEAPPILQWDTLERRNPFSLYVYVHGSPPERWGLRPGYVPVTAVSLRPNQWYGEYPHHGKGVLFVLEGAKDPRCEGLALFPETLKAELHSVRATIEAHSASGILEGKQEASACGILLSKQSEWKHKIRVTTRNTVAIYELDRWD